MWILDCGLRNDLKSEDKGLKLLVICYSLLGAAMRNADNFQIYLRNP